jgi:hypothetical protein
MSKSFQAFSLPLLLSLTVSTSLVVEGQRKGRPRTRRVTSSSQNAVVSSALQNRLDLKTQGISIRYPDGWSSPPQQYENMQELVNLTPQSRRQ